MPQAAESRQRVWIVPGPLVVWAAHFMLCYITAALWCGMVVDRLGTLGLARVLIAIYTVAALAAIGGIAWLGRQAYQVGDEGPPHDADSPEDRHRFLGFATLLIAGLSTVGVIYSAMAAVFVETCL
jgi:hypothetical protein